MPSATSDFRDFIFIVSDGIEMTLARWIDVCVEDPNSGADADEFEFLPMKSLEIRYWYGPICAHMQEF